jgi:hypothetical protein
MAGSGTAIEARVKISVVWTLPRRTKAHRCRMAVTRAVFVAVTSPLIFDRSVHYLGMPKEARRL